MSKSLFHFLRSSTEIIEFGYEKFPKNISSEDGISKESFEIESSNASSKKKQFKSMDVFKHFFSS